MDTFFSGLQPAERDIKVVRPLYSVEITETETAKFEMEISEEEVHGTWKLKGEALHQSAVSQNQRLNTTLSLHVAALRDKQITAAHVM